VADIPELLTPDEVAKTLKVTIRHVYYLISTDQLRATRPTHKTLRIYADSLAAFIARGDTQTCI